MVGNKKGTQKIPLVFYRTSAGAEPVLEWLKSLSAADRKEVGRDLMHAQWRWPVSMPLCKPMGQGLWEVRSSLQPIASPACCSACTAGRRWRCMGSSRKRRRRRRTI